MLFFFFFIQIMTSIVLIFSSVICVLRIPTLIYLIAIFEFKLVISSNIWCNLIFTYIEWTIWFLLNNLIIFICIQKFTIWIIHSTHV